MKVLFVAHYSDLLGANRSLLSIIKFLSKNGVKVCVVVPIEGDLVIELQKLEVTYIVQEFHFSCLTGKIKGTIISLINIFKDLIYLDEFKNKVANFKPDIIYSNSSVIYHGYLISRKLNIPHIWHLREFGFDDYGCRHPITLSMFKKLLLKSSAVISISKSIAAYYSQLSNPNSYIIYNGVNFVEQSRLPKSFDEDKVVKLLMVGHISEAKGQFEAIKAFEKLINLDPNFLLTIVGTGDSNYMNKLIQYCLNSKSLVNKVIFAGYTRDARPFYNENHYLLMYSKAEAFGRVTVEAMQSGLPVIAYNSGGSAEIIDDRINGFLFDNYVDSLIDLISILKNNKSYQELSRNAIDSSVERFSEYRYVSDVLSLINKVYLLNS